MQGARFALAGAIAASSLASRRAAADPDRDASGARAKAADLVEDGGAAPLARGAADAGAIVRVEGGYDAAAKAPVVAASAQVRVWRHLAAAGGAQWTSHAGGSLRPFAGAILHLGRVALSAVYRPEGLTEPEGELELGVDVAHRLGPLAIAGGLTYGQDPDARERDAEEQLGALVRAGGVWLGVGERARVALGTPGTGEPTWDLDAGPHVSVDAHVAVVTAFVGVAARDEQATTTVGAVSLIGVARAF